MTILYTILLLSFILGLLFLDRISIYLKNKPKDNKLRKWWSSHIVDLDDLY